MSKFILTLPEFNRIHQVVHGTIKNEARVEKACTFFAIFGSFVLNKHYHIPARPVAGAFSLCVAEGPKNMFYGTDEGGKIGWSEDGFHMWVQTKTHIIDFMSPIYDEAFAAVQSDITIPRKMFQKRLDDECSNLGALQNPGDFMTFPDADLSESLTEHFTSRLTNTDLIECADVWFGHHRAKQRPSIMMGSSDGITHTLTLPNTVARGPW